MSNSTCHSCHPTVSLSVDVTSVIDMASVLIKDSEWMYVCLCRRLTCKSTKKVMVTQYIHVLLQSHLYVPLCWHLIPSSLCGTGTQAYSDFTYLLHLFQGLPQSQQSFGLCCRICLVILLSVLLSKWFIWFCVPSVLFCTDCSVSFFLISSFLILSNLVQCLTVKCLVATIFILFMSRPLIVQNSPPLCCNLIALNL